jgi:hypothetical protein
MPTSRCTGGWSTVGADPGRFRADNAPNPIAQRLPALTVVFHSTMALTRGQGAEILLLPFPISVQDLAAHRSGPGSVPYGMPEVDHYGCGELVDESSEEVVTSKPLQRQMGGYDRRGAGLGWDETEPTMRSVLVVVAYVDGQDTLEVATADDEQVVKAAIFAASGFGQGC